MLINFLNENLKPKVSCCSPASEGYEVSNLISKDVAQANKGFLAFPCIRTPIEIDFELICGVNIHHIVLWPVVGNQKATGFELLGACGAFDSYQVISKCYKENRGYGIIFYNARTFQRRIKVSVPDNYSAYAFSSSQWRVFTSCLKLKLRIMRTENSVPCLGKIEIWGYVSKRCCHSMERIVREMYNCNRNGLPNQPKVEQPQGNNQKSSLPSSTDQLQIPDEFLDAITFEIMSVPMTLPSGNTVDKLTIEKHNDNQQIWARAPHDPFTGQTFTETSKPIFNSALKRRIDLFLLEHQDHEDTKKVARTVGRVSSAARHCDTSSLLHKRARYDHSPYESVGSVDNNIDVALNTAFSALPNLKRFTSITSPPPSLTSVTFDPINPENPVDPDQCAICEVVSNLYMLKCKHLMCRNCLTSVLATNSKCAKCHLLFCKSDVRRYHF